MSSAADRRCWGTAFARDLAGGIVMRLVGWAAVICAVTDWWSLATLLTLIAFHFLVEERKRPPRRKRTK